MIGTVYLTRNSIAAIILLLASVMVSTLASAAQDDTAVETAPLSNHSPENDGNAVNEEITPDIAATEYVSDKPAIVNEPVKGSSSKIDDQSIDNEIVPETLITETPRDGPVLENESASNTHLEISNESAEDGAAPDSHEADVASDNLTIENDPALNYSTDIDSDTAGNGVVPDSPETDTVSDKPAIVNEPVKDSSLEINDNPIDHKAMPNHVSMIDAGTNTSDQGNQSTKDYNLPIILVVLCFVALVVSLWVNLFLLKWRRSVTAGDVSIVPSELLGIVSQQTKAVTELKNQQRKHIEDLFHNLTNFASLIKSESDETRSSSSELLEAFTGLQKALNEKDTEIQRLRSGYDTEIYRRFVGRFIRLDKVLSEEIDDLDGIDTKQIETLKDIKILLIDALADCGLEQYSPSIGQNIREAEGVDENYKCRPAQNLAQELTIAEVLEQGWRTKTPDGYEIIKSSRVAVYVKSEDVS